MRQLGNEMFALCLFWGMRKQEEGVSEPRVPEQGVVWPHDITSSHAGERHREPLFAPLWAASLSLPDSVPGLKVQWATVHWPVLHLLGRAGEPAWGFCVSLTGRSRGYISPCDVGTFATNSHLGRKISNVNATFQSPCSYFPFPNHWLVTVTSLTSYHFMWSIYIYTSCLSVSSESSTFH